MTLHLGDSGIALNAVDALGVDWGLTSEESPWSPSPQPRSVTGENATDHGSWDATQFYGPRTYALEGDATVRFGSDALLVQAEQRLKAAIGLKPFDLRFVESGFDRQATFRRESPLSWRYMTPTWAIFSVSIVAPDPRIYSTDTYNASVAFPTSTGGMSWPAVWPATWDAVTVTGEMSLSNDGTETAWPTYRIDGPVAEPVIVNADTGQSMHFSITLGPGEWLTVDTGSHEVLGNGDPNASRRNVFHGDWFGLAPGSTTVRFNGASGVGSTLSASWRSTWI